MEEPEEDGAKAQAEAPQERTLREPAWRQIGTIIGHPVRGEDFSILLRVRRLRRPRTRIYVLS